MVAGAVIGFSAGWLLHSGSSAPAGAATTASRVAQLEAALKSRTQEVERLTKSGGKSPLAGKIAADKIPDAPGPEHQAEATKMQERMKKQYLDKQKLKIDERLASLRTRLGLNDKQAAAIRELLEKNPEGPQAVMMAAMSGEKVDEAAMVLNVLRPGQKAAEVTSQISALLTPEQQQTYTAVRQEQRTNEIEIKTGKELARLQSSLTLSPEQKDKAFAVLSTLAEQEYDTSVSPIVGIMAQQLAKQPDGPGTKELQPHVEEIKAAADLAAQRRQQRVEAMKEILSPEQFKLYEDQQKQGSMAEMLEGFGDMPGAFFMGAAEEPEAAAAPPVAVPRK